jgi:O-antigen/teichoic acid export membrane protein
MILISVANLYIVRLALQILGEVDYGVYSVIAGLVMFANLFSGTLGASTTRFFAFYLGRSDYQKLNVYLSNSLTIFLIFSGLVSIFFYFIGPYVIRNFLNIPEERIDESVLLFFISIFSFSFNLFRIPFNSLIITFEKFDFFALIGVVEVLLKIGLIYSLIYIDADKLLLFGALNMILALVVLVFYLVYSLYKIKGIKIGLGYDKLVIKEILHFSGWTLIGTTSSIVNTQGLNIVINVYFGPVVSAARAVSMQLYQSVLSFSHNVYSSFKPGIIKEYSKGEFENSLKLVSLSSKSVFVILVIILILLFNMAQEFLVFWLGTISDTMVILTKLILFVILFDSLAIPLNTINSATGKISVFQIAVGVFKMLSFPVSLVLYGIGFNVESLYFGLILISVFSIFLRIYIIENQNSLKLVSYKVLVFRFFIALLSCFLISNYLKSQLLGRIYLYFGIHIFVCSLLCLITVFNKDDFKSVLNFINKNKKFRISK